MAFNPLCDWGWTLQEGTVDPSGAAPTTREERGAARAAVGARLALPRGVRLLTSLPILVLAGCLGDAPAGTGPTMNPGAGARTPVESHALMPQASDPGAPPDLGSSSPAPRDLGGLTDCFGVAICDPAQQFCIKFFDGSQAAPGNMTAGPACFAPSDTCGNQGQNMDCGCIQNDPQLGMNCQGSCVDNGNGTYFCYAQ